MTSLFRSSGGRLARFALVGAGANVLLLMLVYLFQKIGMPVFLAGALGYAIAFAAAYSAQRNWTFAGVESADGAFWRYLAAQICCAVLAGVAGQLCVALTAASPFWTSVAVTGTAALSSYLVSSLWVFAARPSGS